MQDGARKLYQVSGSSDSLQIEGMLVNSTNLDGYHHVAHERERERATPLQLPVVYDAVLHFILSRFRKVHRVLHQCGS